MNDPQFEISLSSITPLTLYTFSKRKRPPLIMPKWVFHHTAGTLTPEEKQCIAQQMTQIYTSVGLPPFYCHVHFFELGPENDYAGGENPPALTTLSIYHIARALDSQEIQNFFFKAVDYILRPILKPKGVEWELGIYEASRELWRVNGLIAPPTGSDMEKKWFEANAVTDEEELLKAQPHP